MSKLVFIFIVLIAFFSCNNDSKKIKKDPSQYKEPLVRVNKFLVKKDVDLISAYLGRRNWKMDTTSTGLYYLIYQKGTGRKAEKGKIATIKYKINLLDGTLCYSSDSTGAKSFLISQGNVETGLEEGILMMNEGDKARFIMPPYMAHGLVGDDDKIPPRSIIVYHVELIKISD